MNSDPLRIDPQVSQLVLVGFLKNEITKSGFVQAVLNATGGVDMTMACYLAVKALGPENVTAFHVPATTSESAPWHDIRRLEFELGIVCHVVDPSPLIDLVLADSESHLAARRCDAIARFRMMILYIQSDRPKRSRDRRQQQVRSFTWPGYGTWKSRVGHQPAGRSVSNSGKAIGRRAWPAGRATDGQWRFERTRRPFG